MNSSPLHRTLYMEIFVSSPMFRPLLSHNNCKTFPVLQRVEQQEIFSVDFTQLVREKTELKIYVAVTSGEQKFLKFVCLFFFRRIVVRIDFWEVDSMYPSGHFVRSLGPIGDLETEIQALMVEHSLAAPSFTEAQLRELPSNTPENPWVISEEEVGKRRDLR